MNTVSHELCLKIALVNYFLGLRPTFAVIRIDYFVLPEKLEVLIACATFIRKWLMLVFDSFLWMLITKENEVVEKVLMNL